MRLKLTDGKSSFEVVFAEDADMRDCHAIRESKMPVSKAITLAKKRYGEMLKGWFPVQGLALSGL